MNNKNTEIEAHFLEIDVEVVHKKLLELNAEDCGEDLLQEIIFYDKESTWQQQNRFVRLRKNKKEIVLTFKHFQYENDNNSPDMKPVVSEIETRVTEWKNTILILESIGLVAFREQEKKRHSYKLDDIIFDIDTWPTIPPYLEIEGDSVEKIETVATALGFDIKKAIYRGAGYIINHFYNIPVKKYKYFTFAKIG